MPATIIPARQLLKTGVLEKSQLPKYSKHDTPLRVVQENAWFPLLTDYRHRMKIIRSGRGGGKTHACASAIPRLMHRNRWPSGEPMRICVMREILKSIEKSCKAALEDKIKHLGFAPYFEGSTQKQLTHDNGSECFFQGMSSVTEEEVRGLESLDILWFEEAQNMSRRSWEILLPTIRKKHSEIWLTFNPRERADPAWELFVRYERAPDPKVLTLTTNYDRNKFFTEENESDRLDMLQQAPHRYPHVWLGEPDDGASTRKLLPYGDLRKCIKRQPRNGYIYAGLDIAAKGDDFCSIIIQQSGSIIYHERWAKAYINDTVRRAVSICDEYGVNALFFDETGLGAGAVSTLRDIAPGFMCYGVGFGEAVMKPNATWGITGKRRVTQKDKYERRTSQLGDAVRQRLQCTLAFLRGDTRVEVGDCLWIDPDVNDLETLLKDLAQPEEDETKSGRMIIEKSPKPEGSTTRLPSPDSYDATILAFGRDSLYGLKRPKYIG